MAYIVSKYDPSDDHSQDGDWTEVAQMQSLWALRAIVRDLEARGYDRYLSIAVDRVETEMEKSLNRGKEHQRACARPQDG